MKRGIYLVANLKSQQMCENLIYSIRKSGCVLPIRLIHFGGKEIRSHYILSQVEFLNFENFSADAKQFIDNLRTVLTDCPLGYLYRYLAWFSDWDEFIYSDNDIVAFCNWEILFKYLSEYDLVHADQEYLTNGKYNYEKPESINTMFSPSGLNTLFTAGHFVARNKPSFISDVSQSIKWFRKYPDIPKKHDQSLLHIATLIGKWSILNLCKPPHNWMSTWAGDYKNSLELINAIQKDNGNHHISHLHYSGGIPSGIQPIHEYLYSYKGSKYRLRKLVINGCKELFGYYFILRAKQYINSKLKHILKDWL